MTHPPEAVNRFDSRMHPLSLRFLDPALERQFSRSWMSATRLINQIWSTAALVYYLAYTLVLWVTIPDAGQHALWLRPVLAVPAILLSMLPLYTWPRLMWLNSVGFFCATITAFIVAAVHYRLHDTPWNVLFLLELAVIFAYGQHYNRIRFVAVVWYSLTCIVILLVLIYLTGDNAAAHLVPLLPFIFIIAALTGVGVLASYMRETFIRRNYASIRALRLETEAAVELRAEAEMASQSKSRFLAIMSHELRTPLNAIIGYSEMMKLGIIGEVQPPRAREYLEHILESGRHLLAMVNDILDLSRTEAGRVRIEDETIAVVPLLQQALAELAPRAQQHGHRVRLQAEDDLPSLRADPRLVHQMLSNLLTNAIKFTPAGGRVTCFANLGEQGEMIVGVRDTGVGIAADKLDSVFQPFEQVDDGLDRRNDGVGLGLPLTRSLIEAHGGRIGIESAPGRGTTVTLVFPASRVGGAGPDTAA